MMISVPTQAYGRIRQVSPKALTSSGVLKPLDVDGLTESDARSGWESDQYDQWLIWFKVITFLTLSLPKECRF